MNGPINMSQALSPATSLENGDDSVTRKLSRSYVACTRCHDHKVKCTGETPRCRNCQRAKEPRDCVYPVRDRKLSVPERYVLLVMCAKSI
jgi:proline utilization trans-activator